MIEIIDPMPLQAMCDASKDFADYMTDWQFVEAFACQYANTTGFTVLALIVYGAISGSIFIRTDSLIIPFGLFLVIGGAALSQMASVAVPVAVTMILVVPAAVTAFLYAKYS